MPPVYLPPVCFLLDPPTPLQLGLDFAWDPDTNAIQRFPEGAIPPGAEVVVRQQTEVESALVELLEQGEVVAVPLPRLRVQAITGWEHDPTIHDWDDLVWRVEGSDEMGSWASVATLYGSADLVAAWEALTTESPGLVIRIAAVLSTGLVVPVFTGFVVAAGQEADASGRVASSLLLHDPLLRLAPPYVRLESRRWGRTLQTTRTVQEQLEVAGFTVQSVVEERTDGVLPQALAVCRDIFAAPDDPWFTDISLGFLDFPLIELDGRDRTPLELLTTIARLAGAELTAVGRLLLIHEAGPASRRGSLSARYASAAIVDLERGTQPESAYTAIQLFGHCETGLVATRPQFPYVADPAQPGYVLLGETQGTLAPREPGRSEGVPAPVLITFTFNATVHDPATLIVEGARRIGPPAFRQEGAIRWATIELEIPWATRDHGEPPFTLDAEGDPRFVVAGQVIDALASADGEPQPIPYATVTIIRLAGDQPTPEEYTQLADDLGFYRFTDVALGRWRVEAEAPGYRPNWEDSDPENNLIRDLEAEYADWLADGDGGRYEKLPTSYHVRIFGRPYPADPGIQDLSLGQVRVEVRAAGVAESDLHYAPAIRDARLTTERLAIRVGQILLWAAHETTQNQQLTVPYAPLLRPGDRLVIREGGEDRSLRIGSHHWALDASETVATSRFAAIDASRARRLVPDIADDPLGTGTGTVVAVYRNVIGQELADVESEGQTLTGLGANPLVGRVEVGEIVQIAKWFPGATAMLIVARSPMVFGPWRIATVEVS